MKKKVDINKMNIKINKRQLLFSIVICFFILCEYCEPFYWLDQLHIKHFLMIGVVFVFGILLIKKKNIIMCMEMKKVFWTTGILYTISLFFQMLNGFKFYSVLEVYYFLIPMLFAIIVFNFSKKDNVDFIMTAILITCLFAFVVTRLGEGVFTFENLRAMFSFNALFIESTSVMRESDLSIFFVFLFTYFMYRREKIRTVMAGIGCFLGYKRFAVLFLIILMIALRLIRGEKKLNKSILNVTIIFFCIAPFVAYVLCTDDFASWFYSRFKIDFNAFSMTRFQIINTVIDAKLTNYGLGTVTDFLELRGVEGQLNMHNDILRIYMETTIIGTIVFTRNYFKMAETNWYSFFTMLFIFVELFVAHFLGPGAISFWCIAYLALFTYNLNAAEQI